MVANNKFYKTFAGLCYRFVLAQPNNLVEWGTRQPVTINTGSCLTAIVKSLKVASENSGRPHSPSRPEAISIVL
jgi:predicted transposase YdaD